MESDQKEDFLSSGILETSKKDLRSLFNSMEDFIFVLDYESRILYVNSIVIKRLKYSKDELIGKTALMVHPPERREEAAIIIGEMIKGEKEICPIPLLTKEGKLIPVETKVTKGKWGHQKILIGISRDVSERIKYETVLKNSEEKYRELYEKAPTAFFSIGIDKKIKRYNNAALKILGYTGDEFLNLTVFDLYANTVNGLEKAKKLFQLFLKGEKIQDEELQMRRKNGEIIWISLTVNPVFSDSREIIESRSLVIDITERKKAEQKLMESEERYRDAFNQASLYKDIFAHDINNILQNIQSSLELSSLYLKNPEKMITVKELYGIIKEQVTRGSKLITNVRKLSTLHESKFTLKPIRVSHNLKESVKFLKQSFQTRKINVQYNYNKIEYFVYANELLLDIFENILLNAVRHNSNVNIEIEIKVSKEKIKGKRFVKIQFIDNGDGIEDIRKKYIFQRGSKEKSSNGGMGLGLSLVKKTIDRYNGKIWVEDRIKKDHSKGSNFILLIPEGI